jgi:hypothetical protein
MAASGRVVGAILLGAGAVIGIAVVAWLVLGLQEDNI